MEISQSQIAVLPEKLEKFIPRSLHAYNWCKFVSNNFIPASFRPRCVVDSWPNVSLIFCSHFEPPTTREWLSITCFETDKFPEDKVVNFLHSVDKILGLHEKKCRIHVLKNTSICAGLLHHFTGTGTDRYLNGKMENQFGLELWWTPPENYPEIISLAPKSPADLYLSSVRVSEAAFVNSTWPHHFPGSEVLFEKRIRYLPSKCFRKKSDDSLVSFNLTHFLGFSHHRYTVPERRGEHLMPDLAVYLWQDYIALGMVPFGLVVPENANSIKAMTRGGASMVNTDETIFVLHFVPLPVESKL